MPKRYKQISADDEVAFDWSAHALNACFGKNYSQWMKGTCKLGTDEYVWFPKLAIVDKGQPMAQDKVYGCINVYLKMDM